MVKGTGMILTTDERPTVCHLEGLEHTGFYMCHPTQLQYEAEVRLRNFSPIFESRV